MIYNDFEEQDYSYSFSFDGWDYFTIETVFPGKGVGTVYYKKRPTGRQFRQITIKEYEDAKMENVLSAGTLVGKESIPLANYISKEKVKNENL